MQAVPVVFSEPSEILLARGTRTNKKMKCIHEKSDSNESKTKLECRKVKCGTIRSKIRAKSTNMQALPLGGSIFKAS